MALLALGGVGSAGCVAGTTRFTELENDPPIAMADEATVAEDTPLQIDVLLNDFDPEGRGPLRVGSVGSASHGVVSHNDRVVTYIPEADFNGDDSLTYVVVDVDGAEASADVAITITPVNDPPVALGPPAVNVDEDTSTPGILLGGADLEEGEAALTVSVSLPPSSGGLSRLGGAAPLNVVYTPDPDFAGADWFEFEVTDSEGGRSAPVGVGIIVAPINDAPLIATNAGLSLVRGAEEVIGSAALEATDVDNTPPQLVFTVDAAPAFGSLRRNSAPIGVGATFTQLHVDSGALSYAHGGLPGATDSFAFTVTDGQLNAVGTFILTITSGNSAPFIATNLPLPVDEGGSVTIANTSLATTDTDTAADQLVYTIDIAPVAGQLSRGGTSLGAGQSFTQAEIDAATINYTHDGSETTADSFDFTVTDGTTPSAASFSLIINPINDPPVLAVNDGMTVAEGGTIVLLTLSLSATDVDDGAAQIIYRLTAAPTRGVLSSGATPLALNDAFSQAELAGGAISYQHDGSETLTDSFGFDLEDGVNTVSGNVFDLVITPVSDPPVLTTNLPVTAAEGGTVLVTTVELQTTDVDNTVAQLVYTIGGPPTNGELTRNSIVLGIGATFTQQDIDTNRMSYAHDGSETLSDTVLFSVSDGTSTLPGNILTVNVTPISDPPVIVTNAGATVAEGGSTILGPFELAVTDVDNTPSELVFTLTAPPTNGTLYATASPLSLNDTFTATDLQAGQVSYTHSGSETLIDNFGFTLTDGTTPTADLFTFTVTPVNDLPVASPVAMVALDQDASSAAFILTGTDVEDSTIALTVDIVSGPLNGNLDQTTGPAPLSVTYTPNAGFSGGDTFQFTVTDTGLGVSSAVAVNLDVVGALVAAVVTAGDVGADAAIIILGTTVHVAFHDAVAGEVNVVRSDDNGRSWGPPSVVGAGRDPAIGADGTSVYVSYWDDTGLDLEFARSDDLGDSWPLARTVDGVATDVGEFNSLAVEPGTGRVYVSYFDASAGDLKAAASSDDGDTWTLASVDGAAAIVGEHSSIVLKGASIFVSYYDNTNATLKFARSVDQGVTWPTIVDVDAAGSAGTFTAIAADCGLCGLSAYIAYYDFVSGDLQFARSDNNGLAWPTLVDVDTGGDVGQYAAIAVSGNSLFVAYYDLGGTSLRFARSDDRGDTWPTLRTVDAGVDVGEWSTIAVAGATVFIAYYDRTNGDLKVARSVDAGDSW